MRRNQYTLSQFRKGGKKDGEIMPYVMVRCAGCGKPLIKGDDVYKQGRSFDLFHKKCFKPRSIDLIIMDESGKLEMPDRV